MVKRINERIIELKDRLIDVINASEAHNLCEEDRLKLDEEYLRLDNEIAELTEQMESG